MILYRGTPVPEKSPEPREYAAVFFASDKQYAATYGEFVQTYEVGRQKILGSGSREAFDLVWKFRRRRPDKLEIEDLFFHPTPKLVRFLSKFGFTGTAVGDNIGLWDLRKVKFLKSEQYYHVAWDLYKKVPRSRRLNPD